MTLISKEDIKEFIEKANVFERIDVPEFWKKLYKGSLIAKVFDGLDSGLSIQGILVRELVEDFNGIVQKMIGNSAEKSELEKEFDYPAVFEVEKIDTPNFVMERLHWKNSGSKKVILQLHGGGYIGDLKNYYRVFAGLYSEVSHGMDVLTIDYRTAPKDLYPAALEDALYAFDWLLEQGYSEKDIYVCGDSAGGGLTLCLCHYLKDKDRELPKGLVLMSPWADLTCSGESYTENFEIDPLFGREKSKIMYENPYYGEHDPHDKYISPVFGDFDDFPPMLIQAGTNEMLLSDSKTVAKKVREAEGKVRLSVYEGMFHVFQVGTTMMPESKRAWAEIEKFFEKVEEL